MGGPVVTKGVSVQKIKVEGVVVELDGDEMTRIIWQFLTTSIRVTWSTCVRNNDYRFVQ